MSVDDLITTINRDRQYWGDNGGVTFTGGEPLLQHNFLREALKRCYDSYIHTAVETCGCVSWDCYEETLPFLDWIFFDVKHMHPSDHREGTGSCNRSILDNLLKIAAQFREKLILRIPLIPGYNDTNENISMFVDLAERIGALRKEVFVNILPMHHLAREKYNMLGLPYLMGHVREPTHDEMLALKKKLVGHGVICYIGKETPF